MVNALGIDVEEWYHICGLNMPSDLSNQYESRIEDNIKRMLDVLHELQTKATFFVLGVIAEKYPDAIRKINDAGHEIASHGYRHLEVHKQTPDMFRVDLKKSMEILKGITGKPVLGYRAPDFSIINKTLWAVDILIQEGIKYDCSIFPVRHPRYGIPAAPRVPYRLHGELIEFPVSTIRFAGENFPVAGGAYFRFLPYNWIKAAFEQLNQQGIIVNSYIHVWELDSKQPKLKIPLKRSFAHYTGLEKMQEKFENLLADFQYAPLGKIIEDGRF